MSQPEISIKSQRKSLPTCCSTFIAQAETILIVVTHSKELAARFPQRFELKNQHLEPL